MANRISSVFFTRRGFCSYNNVIVEDKGPIRIVSINRPDSRNCVNTQTSNELYHAFTQFEQDPSVLVGILAGKGQTFCAGYDLKELSKATSVPSFEPFSLNSKGPMGPTRLFLSKPVIACLTGYAVAGGLELALWCDLRVAEENVKMGVFCRRFGVPLIDGGTVRLPMMIGLSPALDLILTGREVLADEGLRIGLINRIVPTGTGLQETIKLANEIAAFPQACLRKDRHSAIHSAHIELEHYMKQEFHNGTDKDLIEEAIKHSKTFSSSKSN